MTDEELIAALGWQPCKKESGNKWCEYHDSQMHGSVCAQMLDQLDCAEQGIDLAKQGIADKLQAGSDRAAPPEWKAALAAAAVEAREWTP